MRRKLWRKGWKFLGFHWYSTPWALGCDGIHKNRGPRYTPTWEEWRRKVKALVPIQYWLREDVATWFWIRKRRMHDRWYEFKCWLKPYNVLKIATLPKTWTDERELMMHAMFAVLKRYMDSKPGEHIDFELEYDSSETGQSFEEHEKYAVPYRLFWKEINEAWDWWNKQEEREKAISAAYGRVPKGDLEYNVKYGEVNQLEKQFEDEEDEMLTKLLKHRRALWM